MTIISLKNTLKAFICLAAIFSASSAFAATYYVDPAAASDGTGSATSPKKYITSGISIMSAGDTLILRDGTYTGAKNMIGDYGSPRVYPPSGSAGSYTTIKAANVGKAIIDGQYATTPYSQANGPTYRNYLRIDGIHFRRGKSTVFSIAGTRNWVSNCGFEDGQAYSDNSQVPIAYIGGNSTYNLIEDCWIWGKGRYGFYTSNPNSAGSSNNIFRRLVVRMDASPSNWMSAGLRFYSAHDDAMQNCIVIDSLTGSNSGDGGSCTECWSYAQGGGSSGGEWGHIFNSNIALNNPKRPAFTNESGNSNGAETWTNSVWWDVQYGMLVYANLPTVNTWNISNMLMGGKSSAKTFGDAFYYGGNRNEIIKFSNSIVANASGSAYGPSGRYLSRAISNVNVYNNGSATCNSGDGCNNSGQTTSNPFTSLVKYLPRVESGTQGPRIMYQVGGTGSFYGESGWNSNSTNELWPYPNEQIWAAKMKAYAVNSVSGNRGFAALAGSSATPLTDYIWGYLGNPKPDIYGAGSTGDTTVPTASITAPTAGASVTGTVSVTASASDNVGVDKLEFYVNGALKATDTATPYLYSWDTSALAAGTYTLMAKAYDAANNVGQSSSVSVTVAKDTTAPVASIATPVNAATVSGTITCTASATDNLGVTKVELYGNGALLTAGNVSPLSYSWNTTTAANGSYTLTAKAYDAAGNVGQTSRVVTVSNASSSPLPAGTVSIWPATATPGVVDNGPDSAVELGVKFRSDVAGYITGLRFYKASTNTGVHVGNLWSSTGTRLATATFTNETASGWQSVTFPTPVAIAANTVYVVSYHTTTGHYSNDQNYFTGKGMDNGSLHALADGVSGTNGVYRYGSTSGFPSSSWNAANYWVDPLMTTTAPVTPPAPAAETLSIWPATATPGVIDPGPDSAVELGVKFRSDVAGYITGLRFYKASTNTGVHVGNLWSSTGTRLATATFTNETASGWQKVTFPTPVAIAANTVYVVSYHTTAGHYSNDQNYFSGKGMDNGPLHALAEGVSGSNGVYRYGSTSGFPNASWNASNYWVDPLMTTTAPTTTAPTTTAPTTTAPTTTAPTTTAPTTTVPIAFAQVAAYCPQTAAQTVAVSYPLAQKAGNLNIVVVGWNDTTSSVQSVRDSLGNVYTLAVGPTTGTGLRQSIYYAKGIVGGANKVTVTFNRSARYVDVRVLEYSGVSTLDKTAGASGSSSTSSSGSVTTTAAKELIFSANTVATGTSAAGAGFTKRIITSPNSDLAQDRIVSATGTYGATAPLTSSGPWVMQTATFK